MQHMMKDILTTKITKATKGSDILLINFVLFVCFVVKILLFWLRLCLSRFSAVKPRRLLKPIERFEQLERLEPFNGENR
jgi:hypothetical protein